MYVNEAGLKCDRNVAGPSLYLLHVSPQTCLVSGECSAEAERPRGKHNPRHCVRPSCRSIVHCSLGVHRSAFTVRSQTAPLPDVSPEMKDEEPNSWL